MHAEAAYGIAAHFAYKEQGGKKVQDDKSKFKWIEELKDLNQTLRNRDKMKDDAIAHLSDQLVAITSRLQEVERRQQL